MTDTYNPIIDKIEISSLGFFQKRPIAEPGIALVFSGEGEPLLIVTQGERGVTKGEIISGKYRIFYKIDLKEYPLSFTFTIPCATDAFDFNAEIKFVCAVEDPEKIVIRGVNDVKSFLEPLMEEVIRRISRNFQVEETLDAEKEISARLKRAIYDEGFQVDRLVLKLSLEKEIRDRIRNKKLAEDTVAIEITKIKQDQRIESERQLLEIQRLEFENKHKEMQAEFEIKQIKMKMEFYEPILKSGNWGLLAMQLSQNPDDVVLIAQKLNEEKQLERDHNMKMLKVLLQEGALEGSQLNEVGRRTLQGLLAITEQYTPSIESGDNTNDKSTIVEKTTYTEPEFNESDLEDD
jgi:hypothetical protein